MFLHGFMRRLTGKCLPWAGKWRIKRISRHLNLDSNQQAQLDTLHQRLLASMMQWHEARRRGRSDIAQLLLQDQPERDGAKTQLQNHLARLGDLSDKLIDDISDFVACLNPPQREQLRSYLQQRRCACHRGCGR
jgi:Spy/CpxP family protein refolding chaperone